MAAQVLGLAYIVGEADTGIGSQGEQEGDPLLSARLMVCTG